MGRRKAEDQSKKHYAVTTHLTAVKYQELQELLSKSPNLGMSALVRAILENKPVKVVVRDETQDLWIQEMGNLRTEIRSIGVNINQITRAFNSYPEPFIKLLYAKKAFAEYQHLQPLITQLLLLMQKVSKKWLFE